MRERRDSLPATVVAKVHREGPLSLLREGPGWVVGHLLTAVQLASIRRLRRFRYRRAGLVAIPDPTATIEIDPQAVTHIVPLSRFETSFPRRLLGTVRGGDWDRNLPRIENQPKYQACQARVAGTPWTDTGIVDHLAAELERVDADTIEHGCDSRAALRQRYEGERETLYRSLRDEGYDRAVSPVCCRVHIGRDGRLLFGSGGRHRFYLSRLLGIESVPAQVLCRHHEWQTVRDSVATADSLADLPPEVRTHLDHPDLREFPLAREAPSDARQAGLVG
ncbi:hypothetical protein [Halodesulfurarchaeum formicicum]|uniref:ParB-like nuclease n=1 Tax=Halodesulfurarchaeum formicicum TaxID=1873524 RepID=A0A1J1ABB9_9EURY|nr:hypothetical protein [Halodesulfurarchaeum formicicum]APE95096.1 hypothetical protein HSR6_0636 [Halodesulfurarchaeum formicicum]